MKTFKSEKLKYKVLERYDAFLKKWNVEYRELDIDGDFGSSHCVISGDERKKTLFLFHGVGDNSAIMWLENIEELSKHFYCIAIDTLGGPGKSVPNKNYSKFDQEKWIQSVLEYFGSREACLLGVSNGAYMAYNYFVHHSENIDKIIGIEGGIVIHPLQTMLKTLSLMFPEILVPTDGNLKNILLKMCHPESTYFTEHPDIVEYIILLMKSHNQHAMTRHRIKGFTPIKDKRIREKMYFLFGEHTRLHNKKLFTTMDTENIRYKLFEKSGHGLNMEKALSINSEIINFFSSEAMQERPSREH